MSKDPISSVCCFAVKVTRKCFCLVLALILVAVIFGLVLFFWLGVKVPTVTYKSSVPPKDGNVVQLPSLSELKVNWDFVLDVKNDNGFGVNFYELTFNGFTDEARTTQISNGTLKDVQIKGGAVTTITFPQTFHLGSNVSTEFVNTVYQACRGNSTTNTKPKIPIYYDLYLGFKLIQFVNYQPKVQNKFDVECPVDLSGRKFFSTLSVENSSTRRFRGRKRV
ncbi:hypothetical protein BKA69DRAFT_1043519 [Paraphysoderma sedebokerense]|nr:hypothetical protein BKA69DRAFT_1043519 [Paraphysoderma sedebokerense]